MKTSYSRHGSSHLGERGKQRRKRKPITGIELIKLREMNLRNWNGDPQTEPKYTPEELEDMVEKEADNKNMEDKNDVS